MLSLLVVDETGGVRVQKCPAGVNYVMDLDNDFREFLAFLAN